MSEYPEDIMKAAEALRAAVNDCSDSDKQAYFIAAFLLAERERCAEIVRTEEELEGDPPPHVVEAMYHAGPVMNARSAVRATKASILKRMGAA